MKSKFPLAVLILSTSLAVAAPQAFAAPATSSSPAAKLTGKPTLPTDGTGSGVDSGTDSNKAAKPPVDPDADYDRLDGKGKSGVKVDFIEWEGNVEVHTYPKGSTAGLAMKIDRSKKDKPVMVMGYRFKSDANNQLIRRHILSIPMSDGFKVYRDPEPKEYDKFIATNHALAGNIKLVTLEPGPKENYPEGHPGPNAVAGPTVAEDEKPASDYPIRGEAPSQGSSAPLIHSSAPEQPTTPTRPSPAKDRSPGQSEGSPGHFSW